MQHFVVSAKTRRTASTNICNFSRRDLLRSVKVFPSESASFGVGLEIVRPVSFDSSLGLHEHLSIFNDERQTAPLDRCPRVTPRPQCQCDEVPEWQQPQVAEQPAVAE